MLVFPIHLLIVGDGQPYCVRTPRGRLLPVFTTHESAVEFLEAEKGVAGLEFELHTFGPRELLAFLAICSAECDSLMIDPEQDRPYLLASIESTVLALREYVDRLDQSSP